jgi:hypothetical protein
LKRRKKLTAGRKDLRFEIGSANWLIHWLVSWLNTKQGHLREYDGDKSRIKILISHLQALSTALKKDPLKGQEEQEALAACTKRYVLSPLFEVGYGPGQGGRGLIENNFLWLRGGGGNEGQAIEALRTLVERRRSDPDALERLVMCKQCGDHWVFRWRRNRQFCSDRCRKCHHEASPKRKGYKLDYMRKRYLKDHPLKYRRKRKK